MNARAALASVVVFALSAACSSFGRGDGGDTPQDPDAGVVVVPEKDAAANSDAPSGVTDGATEVDAGDAGGPGTCDTFNRADYPLAGLWGQHTGTNPQIISNHLVFAAESSSDSSLVTLSRMRGDTIHYEAKLTVRAPVPDWDGRFTGTSRIFDVDASIDADQGEYSGVEINASSWSVIYRTWDGDGQPQSQHLAGPPLTFDEEHSLVFEERFHESAGYIHLTVDGQLAMADNIATQKTPRDKWLLRIGPVNKGSTPSLTVAFTNVCLAP